MATDACIEPGLLHGMLNQAVAASFHRITVDGDTSTNDACVLVATGCADNAAITSQSDKDGSVFYAALESLAKELAKEIVRDAEGATKFVSVQVEQGSDVSECEQVAFTIAHSPLVKTALFASDPNWGRILAAVGRAGLDGLDVDAVTIHIGDVLIAEGGGRAESYREEHGAAVMAKENIVIRIGLGRGSAQATVWTSDLSYDYVKINAEYRT